MDIKNRLLSWSTVLGLVPAMALALQTVAPDVATTVGVVAAAIAGALVKEEA